MPEFIERERLIDLLDDFGCDISFCDICNRPNDDCEGCKNEQLANYLLANGVIVTPCKVGDNIYIFQDDENGQAHIVEGVVCNISIGFGHSCVDFKATYNNGIVFWHSEGDGIGYFSREEAEKALEELNNAND